MLPIVRQIVAPLLSLILFTLGSGLFITLLVVRLHLDGVSSYIIGGVTAAYYAGFVSGSFRIERFIIRVGHIRAFAAFASLLAVVSIVQGLFVIPWLWILLRFVGGFATAGIFIVVESWLLVISGIENRGRILALYLVALYGAQALGQFLINIGGVKSLLPFSIVAMLCSLSVIPLAMTHVSTPQFSEPSALSFKKLYQATASGMMGSFCAGLVLGAIYGLLPLYIDQRTDHTSDVALFMAVVIFGGMALQYPVGRISDYIERRLVLAVVCFLAVITGVVVLFAFQIFWAAVVFVFFFGGFSFTVYPIAVSYACDALETKDIVAGTQSLLLAYSIGSAIGPLLAPFFMTVMGNDGLFIYFILINGLLGAYFIWRRVYIPAALREEQFISVPQTTPIISELDPRGEESAES